MSHEKYPRFELVFRFKFNKWDKTYLTVMNFEKSVEYILSSNAKV